MITILYQVILCFLVTSESLIKLTSASDISESLLYLLNTFIKRLSVKQKHSKTYNAQQSSHQQPMQTVIRMPTILRSQSISMTSRQGLRYSSIIGAKCIFVCNGLSLHDSVGLHWVFDKQGNHLARFPRLHDR